MKQPVLGIVWTVLCLTAGAVIFFICINLLHLDVMTFLIMVPVPFIFGTIIVLNMLQNCLFARMAQPWKGVTNTLAAAVIGSVLVRTYGLLGPAISGVLKAGPPEYGYEIWVASRFPFWSSMLSSSRCGR